jgi:GNAT superfamily N-acetyltransferase
MKNNKMTIMNIRTATYRDAPAIRTLLDVLGYKTTISHLIGQLERLAGQKDHEVWVYELDKEVVGFIAIHFLPQLGFDGDMVVISYLSVDETVQGQGIGSALEEYIVTRAKERKCDRIQLHCSDWRAKAHQFYEQQGYREYPRYYSKRLVYGE